MGNLSNTESRVASAARTSQPFTIVEPDVDRAATDAAATAGRSVNRKAVAALAGLVCGLVVGAALGLFLAPRSGRDNRAWIVQKGREARRRAGVLLDPSVALSIIRKQGVRGLSDVLRRRTSRRPSCT